MMLGTILTGKNSFLSFKGWLFLFLLGFEEAIWEERYLDAYLSGYICFHNVLAENTGGNYFLVISLRFDSCFAQTTFFFQLK